MIDTHCHLTHARIAGDEAGVIARASGLAAIVTIGTGVDDARAAREVARRHPGLVHATAGLDPFSSHRAGASFETELARLTELLREGGFVAIGEIGLDYHYDLDPREVQRDRLDRQLGLAVALDLPVVIHVREAHEDMTATLAAHPRAQGVIHSFTAGPAEAERYLALGWTLAFNGVATFPGSIAVREAARIATSDRIVVETDAPYLAPVPVRGRRCEPAHVAHTLAALAAVRGQEPGELERLTDDNARALFGLV